ncbi:PREDICTED: galactolipase DONGLE, chloroplastic-like [Nicotiana attenuata]|uniref:Galactolipase dongle, chloroplastic n=1 Tax=Nicotiana attenuata TaxID=49451 RepID=A0A1J6J9Z4_NICAT|nr:PREDICTED: galactolipase DONGLE, chloroplastic-like [Nicotiana attenuata]OIT07635.1 galactolipase dongle, chloroplastic [Nicotiana attenuata]
MASTMLKLPDLNMKFSTFSGEFPTKLSSSLSSKLLPIMASTSVHEPLVISRKNITTTNIGHNIMTTTFSHDSNISSNTTNNTLASMWREIQGSKNWENLVNPLDNLLQNEIIRYGEFVAACYNAFDLDPNSKRYLNCKYGKNSMLNEVGLGNSGYNITKYIYATTDINVLSIGQKCSSGRWIGYVAVSNNEESKRLGRRDVLITFRGTVTNPEWIANLMSTLTPARLDPNNLRPEVKVEAGFLSLYTSNEGEKFGLGSCREQLLSEIRRVINMYKGEEMSITIAGHSMGSALALLLAYDIAELGLNTTTVPESQVSQNRLHESSLAVTKNNIIPVTIFSFGGPRVGNLGFKDRCEELGIKVLRIVNVNDPITKLPGIFLNENFRVLLGGKYEVPWSCSCYAHVGVEILLDFFNMQNPTCVHDLGTYLNLLRIPKSNLQVQREEGNDFFNIAKEFFLWGLNISMLYNGEIMLPSIW